MSTTITGLNIQTIAQEAINAAIGVGDSLKGFSVAFNGEKLPGQSVLVPFNSFGAVQTTSGGLMTFGTDGANTVTMKKIDVEHTAKDQVNLSVFQQEDLGPETISGLIAGMVENVNYSVVTSAYAQLTSATFSGVVSANWDESAPTLAKLYALVHKAYATGKIRQGKAKILMPAGSYAVVASVLDQLYRDPIVGKNFEVIPVYASTFTRTAITDGSALGVGFGGDLGGPGDEFSFVASANDKIGYGLHKFYDVNDRVWKMAALCNWGYKVVNTNGLLWAV